MKKIILLSLFALRMSGQSAYVDATILNVTPNPVCAGDSITMCFTVDVVGSIDPSMTYPVIFNLQGQDTTIHFYIYDYLTLYDTTRWKFCDTEHAESGFKLKIGIPYYATPGNWLVASSSTAFALEVKGCYVGIEEYKPTERDNKVYTIYGNTIYYNPNTKKKSIRIN